jgi:hypothetical protein
VTTGTTGTTGAEGAEGRAAVLLREVTVHEQSSMVKVVAAVTVIV